jgi:hypothetical protein
LQLLLRKREAVSFIGTKCPAFVATRWLDLVEILQFLLGLDLRLLLMIPDHGLLENEIVSKMPFGRASELVF